ncbi:HAD-IA family hydrolase [Aliiroseovarius crassostreae]|uniref:HAD-IA family hydrolase n=1 Tax=Aliiroseovarius crassostreae TaxID=154981 RepID=UPI003C79A02C
MTPVLMMDVDGVIITGRPEDGAHWSTSLQQDLGIARKDLMQAFFRPHWAQIVTGHARMIPLLSQALRALGSDVSAQELMAYWFAKDSRMNEALLEALRHLRKEGVSVWFATNQEPHRSAYLWNDLGLNTFADGMLSSADLGVAKPERAFYRAVEDRVGARPDQLFLVDDTLANVDMARAVGWSGHHWQAGDDLGALWRHHRGNTP